MEFQEWFLNSMNNIDWYKVSLIIGILLFIKWYLLVDSRREKTLPAVRNQFKPNSKQKVLSSLNI